MHRRTFVSGVAAGAVAGLAGCLGGDDDAPTTDEGHIEALRAEITDRGVEVDSVELEDRIVSVEHGFDEDPNDAIANVAMAFVERIIDEWDVERLEGHLHDEGNDWSWHAETEWAQEYADEEIGPEEYGQRISETMAMVIDEDGASETDTDEDDDAGDDGGENADDGSDGGDADGDADSDDEPTDDE
ncbi:uncharacterized protein NP_2092A [Natronomonas pharaonis DSM 2160]|uniref:DUF8159 domain-containing protein n=1 Tax=Natronomonas pharaonis (strain ATCC 35678 / DSM 2160 / CIP 103997 / JCM 8858 / NBRC 14720 / NCIMB 2260 / Gabara) TaxID=348780 RepID=A0A1U7EVQ9_NATPD|nr:flagella cluster protein FlaD [Natronomonas pharaonis]CAI49137.1 uncharacterized protein NP_2092A [Natronomonas pharaonis DSM 2160]